MASPARARLLDHLTRWIDTHHTPNTDLAEVVLDGIADYDAATLVHHPEPDEEWCGRAWWGTGRATIEAMAAPAQIPIPSLIVSAGDQHVTLSANRGEDLGAALLAATAWIAHQDANVDGTPDTREQVTRPHGC